MLGLPAMFCEALEVGIADNLSVLCVDPVLLRSEVDKLADHHSRFLGSVLGARLRQFDSVGTKSGSACARMGCG